MVPGELGRQANRRRIMNRTAHVSLTGTEYSLINSRMMSRRGLSRIPGPDDQIEHIRLSFDSTMLPLARFDPYGRRVTINTSFGLRLVS